jgi:predicted dehydrogenase
VDAVVVCTPNGTHLPIGLDVAAAGKHMLIEKPLATSVADAHRLDSAFDVAGRVVMVGPTHRAYDYSRPIKRAIDDGAIGSPRLVRLAVLGGWIWPSWDAWVLDPERSGGHALHNGVHLLDLAAWWLDAAPVSVYARASKQTSKHLGIYDYLEMSVTFENGAMALCEMSRAHRPRSFVVRDTMVVGTTGILSQSLTDESSWAAVEGGIERIPTATSDGFHVQMDSWLDAIVSGVSPVPVADAIAAVAMGIGVEESIATGLPVDLDGLRSREPAGAGR